MIQARKKRVAVLISGRGSNMQALVEAARAPDYPAEIALVVSNRPEAPGLAWAKAQGLATLALNHKLYESREHFEGQLQSVLELSRIDLVALAGFLRLMTAPFVERWQGRMINIHPSLLPAFKGLHTHEQALAAGVRISGCTVHFVTPEMDGGPIIAQAAVPVLPDDTPETLADRVLAAEHKLYPTALARVARDQAAWTGDVVSVQLVENAGVNQEQALFSPWPPRAGY
ncbi:phosphoribosylglycinamide formyltransferase [Hyphomicrobium sp.]|uniref:phosphoribosylglycinamide formyltransferase n=1 Tax=Hyphomicrobium sp. TaxID=82 RepID=UPI0025C73B29|nr:phosphoribosylglycinamide formyltransferase [Hyphomicrobium sp.]MCC7253388.1 phosphoribosylglycinamide formyltransferase [Hyphomicrobium sp.]